MAVKAKKSKTGRLTPAEMRSLINKSVGMNVALDLREENPTEVKRWIKFFGMIVLIPAIIFHAPILFFRSELYLAGIPIYMIHFFLSGLNNIVQERKLQYIRD